MNVASSLELGLLLSVYQPDKSGQWTFDRKPIMCDAFDKY